MAEHVTTVLSDESGLAVLVQVKTVRNLRAQLMPHSADTTAQRSAAEAEPTYWSFCSSGESTNHIQPAPFVASHVVTSLRIVI